MAVDANFASLFENLKGEDPWIPPKTWESIPSESGLLYHSEDASLSSSNEPLYDLSTVSEASLVRLVINAMQGVKSALISIQKLSAIFCSDPADRTFHRISSLWNRASSTHSLGNVLKSIGCTGSLVCFLCEFVDYFTNLNEEDSLIRKSHDHSKVDRIQNHHDDGVREEERPQHSLVNQAFAVAVGKVLEGYMCALDTVYASVVLRRPSNNVDLPFYASSGCLKSVVHSEITLLEFYLHTKELRTQIEALGSICNVHKLALCFTDTSFDDLIAEATYEFRNFYRGGNLLTFLYAQLQVADPAHCTLLKFLFVQSCEPYSGFIRSWIFKAEVNDPYKEFIVEKMENLPPNAHGKAGFCADFPLASSREQDGVAIPCFLKDFLVPLVRAGQQLQVLLKLLELCIHFATGGHSFEDFLPCWSGFSCSSPSYSSPLTFSRDSIEAIVHARGHYYQRMNEKLESLLTSLEVRYQQVATHTTSPFFLGNDGRNLDMIEDELTVPRTAKKLSPNMRFDNMDSDASDALDELFSVEDTYASSESSFSDGPEERIESEQLSGQPCHIAGQMNHISALSFSKISTTNSSIQNSHQREKPESICHETCDKTDEIGHFVNHKGVILNHMSNPHNPGKSSFSCIFGTQSTESLTESYWPMGHLLKSSFDDDGRDGRNLVEKNTGFLRNTILYHDNIIAKKDASSGEALGKDPYDSCMLASNMHAFQSQTADDQYSFSKTNPLSMNPMLTKNAMIHLMGKNGKKYTTDHGLPLPYFNFSTVEDPCKVYMGKLPIGSRCGSGSAFPLDFDASTNGSKNSHDEDKDHDGEIVQIDTAKNCVNASLELRDHNQDVLKVVSGGSTWERLLGSFRKTVNNDATHKQSTFSTFEMPLDIIIDKCLLQEIMLQYKYISKLTINLLEDAFKLQEHLLALRRYHFMEIADWADLFILSLWHHKWSVTEANARLSEIQGLLESSIQRSSCERDPNKDRLFVYMKGHGEIPLHASAIGVRSFDFLGVGYRVDWPVSIVLTPAALKVYAEIFSFLIQVKLAIFSLTNVWCTFKHLVHATAENLNSELHQHEVGHLNMLMKMRHQINHFVSTLQQYVESQLSHVSWCRFLHSLRHKVKDMMDLETVHMEYLADSLHICFLSDETRTVGSIIESILQCALDFRSCLTAGGWDIGIDKENLSGRLSKINISQVVSIKQKFDKNLKELHLCYIKAPKHGGFGLSRFWEYLNYNGYYSNVNSETGYYAF